MMGNNAIVHGPEDAHRGLSAAKKCGVSFQLADSLRKIGKLEAYPTGFFHRLGAKGDNGVYGSFMPG
jgi:hypothetical protein